MSIRTNSQMTFLQDSIDASRFVENLEDMFRREYMHIDIRGML